MYVCTFEIHVDAVLSAPWLALANDDSWQDLLPQIGFSLLHGGHHHVANAGRGKTVQTAFDPFHRNDVEVLRPRVVGAVHRRRHWKTQRHAELVPRRTTTTTLRHLSLSFSTFLP